MTTTFIGDGATLLWSDAGNWDNGIPSPSNDAVLDGVAASGDKNSTIDIAALGAVSLTGYLGTVISNIVTITVNGNFLHNTGTFLSISLNLDIIGSFTTAATLPDFQLISASNMSITGDVIIGNDSCVLENANTFVTVGVGGSTFNILNPDNDNRINDLRLTAGCTMNMLLTVYADTITGPTTGTCTITGAGQIIIIDAWLNGNNIICAATGDGNIELTTSFTPIEVLNYGNFSISSTLPTVEIVGFGSNDLTCFNIFVFQAVQNETVNMTAVGNFNAIINGKLMIGDDVIDNRGGIFEWAASGNLTVGTIELNNIDGIQEAKIIISSDTPNIKILNDFTVGSLAEVVSVPLTNNIIPIGGDIFIDDAAVTDWGTSTVLLTGTGTVTNNIFSNIFFHLSCAFPGETTTFVSIDRTELLTVNGGTVTATQISEELTIGLGQAGLKVFTNIGDTTFDDSAGFFINLKVRGSTGATNTMDGANLQSGNLTIQYSGGIIQLDGAINCNIIRIEQGTFDQNGQNIIATSDHVIDVGALHNLNSGTCSITGQFIPIGTVNFNSSIYLVQGEFDLAFAQSVNFGTSDILFTGNDTTQTINFGTFQPNDVIFARSGGTADLVAAFIATGSIREIALGNNTIQWLDAGAFGCTFILTVGEGSFKTSNISSGAGMYQITVADVGEINRYSGWSLCDIIGAFIQVDLLTGSDDGGNDVTPPFGIDFGNFPIDPISLQGFGRQHKIGGGSLFPNIYRVPHEWHAEFVPIESFLIKNAIGEQVLNAIGEDVLT